jgi:hypothetical protein
MKVENVVKFGSNQEFLEYVERHPEVMKSVSPGGAASRLGITRQGVYNLIKRGKLRAWFVYDEEVGGAYDVPGNSASYVFVSMEDIDRRLSEPKDKGGRPKVLTG